MNLNIKRLSTQSDFDACIELQNKIWGLKELGQTSPITLKALSMTNPSIGLIMGAFDKENMVGMCIVLGTLEKGVAYGHMIGVLDTYRDYKIGNSLLKALIKELKKQGIKEMVCTFEPLESRNAHLYINRQGGRVIAYQADCFQVDTTMHEGLPLDRMVMRMDIEQPFEQKENISLSKALKSYPQANPENMPDADAVLVEIPGDLASLKEHNMESAQRFRNDTRLVFSEYLNQRGFVSGNFFSGKTSKGRQSFYLLTGKQYEH